MAVSNSIFSLSTLLQAFHTNIFEESEECLCRVKSKDCKIAQRLNFIGLFLKGTRP